MGSAKMSKDYNHSFDNPQFQNLQTKNNTEARFFCEAFSLIDAMTGTSLLLAFSNLVKASKQGRIIWEEIPELFLPESKSKGYIGAIKSISNHVEKLVHKGWVTPLRIRSLSCLALEVHDIRKGDIPILVGATTTEKQLRDQQQHFMAAKAWETLSKDLKQLSEFQEDNMAIHEDFQKENYYPHPDSWKVYLATVSFIIMSFIYIVIS